MKMEVFPEFHSGDPSEVEESEDVSQLSEDHTREEVECLTPKRDNLQAQLSGQQEEVQHQKERYTQLWRLSCEQLEEIVNLSRKRTCK